MKISGNVLLKSEKKRADDLEDDFNTMKALRDVLAQEVEDLEDQVTALNSDIDDLEADLDACENP